MELFVIEEAGEVNEELISKLSKRKTQIHIISSSDTNNTKWIKLWKEQ